MRPKMGHLTAEERRLARRLRDQGKTFREIGAAIGCSRQSRALGSHSPFKAKTSHSAMAALIGSLVAR